MVGPDRRLSPAQARQIATVLRLRPGDVVTLLHGGEESDLRIDRIDASVVEGTIVARRASEVEARVAITLAVPLLRGDHTEEVIEAATQLGVARFVPFTSARSVVREVPQAKRTRWERIAREACETSRRAHVPDIGELVAWPALLDALEPPLVVAWEEERALHLRDALPRGTSRLSLVIGPEGGLDMTEVALARERGATVVTLGRRQLRAETAAIAAVAATLALLD